MKFLNYTFCLFLLSALFFSCSSSKYPLSDHFDGELFFNPDPSYTKKGFSDFLAWRWSKEDKPDWEIKEITPLDSFPRATETPLITFINHSTFVIQVNDKIILTDPVWSKRVSPVSWAGPSRYHNVPLEITQLPHVDYVVISHNHYDHLDLATLKEIQQNFDPVFIVPLGNERLLNEEGIAKVIALDWWESHQDSTLKIHLTPARHWSARGMFDRFENLWGSYIIESPDKQVYFAGDTGYGPHFNEINSKFQSVDLALIPIGAFKPDWFMKQNHMGPKEVSQVVQDLKAQKTIVMHFGTFSLGDDGQNEPQTILDSLKQMDPNLINVHIPEPGSSYAF